ncbi:response regulator transcription factor [bacterium]|nr:response regulator transcription factor [bacterium]
MAIKIVLADDHKMLRDGLRPLLQNRRDMEVVGEAEDGHAVLKVVHESNPDILILDISMPGLNGIEITRRLLSENPELRIIILSMHSDRRYVKEALKAGALGYLLKDSEFTELLQAIDSAMQRKIHLSDEIADTVVRDYILRDDEKSSAFTILSTREREVLQQIAEGNATREIADHLEVSIKTIESHRKQIMDKLNLRNVAELTKYAIREGLTSLE